MIQFDYDSLIVKLHLSADNHTSNKVVTIEASKPNINKVCCSTLQKAIFIQARLWEMDKENQGVKMMSYVTKGSVGMDVHYVFIITQLLTNVCFLLCFNGFDFSLAVDFGNALSLFT